MKVKEEEHHLQDECVWQSVAGTLSVLIVTGVITEGLQGANGLSCFRSEPESAGQPHR